MPRKPNPRTLVTSFLLVSAALSVALLAVRNLYDDEISSAALVEGPVRHILQVTGASNVHPPGMYLLAHLAYLIVPSIRWINLFAIAFLYAGLASFLLQVTPLFDRTRSRVSLLLLATLHPQLLMWGTSFRWYSWWTGLALIAVTVALQPRKSEPTLSLPRAATLGLLLACLFYLNYITFLFAFALGAAMLLRYRNVSRSRLLIPSVLSGVIFFILIVPQIPTMLNVHFPNSHDQRSGLAASSLRLIQSVATSEAFLPWHPLALLAGLLFFALCIAGVTAVVRLKRLHQAPPGTGNALASIALFGIVFFFLVAASRLGGKPRNGLLLIPVLAVVAAWIIGTLRPRMQTPVLFFFALWSAVGLAHMFGRYGLTKASMNDRPELVAAFIQQTSGAGCSVVVTYDAPLAFLLAHSDQPRLLIISPFPEDTLGASSSLPNGDCAETTLYAIQSYSGGDPVRQQLLDTELQTAAQYIRSHPRTRFFGIDPDAARKRSVARLPVIGRELSPAALLPDYRYVVTSGAVDRITIPHMRRNMPHFHSGRETAPDAPLQGVAN